MTLVQATAACFVDGLNRATGEIFTVDVPALWSDDPYRPVEIIDSVAVPVAGQQSDAALRPKT